jgi:hypothetical protein
VEKRSMDFYSTSSCADGEGFCIIRAGSVFPDSIFPKTPFTVSGGATFSQSNYSEDFLSLLDQTPSEGSVTVTSP